MSLPIGEKFRLEVQRFLARTFILFEGLWVNFLFRYYFRYRVDDIQSIRRKYREIMGSEDSPVLICSNHLTLIDSIIHAVLFNSTFGHLRKFSALPWNVPERKNFYGKLYWRIICYFGKCIPVDRQGTTQSANLSRDRMLYVIHRGDVLSIFPEGTRSRSGKIDVEGISYGTGQLLRYLPEAKVLCVYMRGKKHGGFADFPAKGEDFHLEMEVFTPKSSEKGLRKARDLSSQIVRKLKEMEEAYFENVSLCRQ